MFPLIHYKNPSDPDATYDGHKGRGYQVQVMETYSDDEDKDQLNLITYVTTEPAHNNDVHAVIPAIEESKQRGLAPKELLADSLYGSDENIGKAKGLGTDLVAPAIGKTPKTKLTLADFSFSEQSRVTSCPQGHAPLKTKYKKSRHSAVFDSKVCEKCACVGDCPASPGKKAYYVRYEEKEVRVAQRRAHEKTPEFRNKYRFRAGAEATMSEFDRRTGVKQLRVRGIKAVSCCATLKAAGINILRAAAFRNRPDKDEMSQKSVMLAPTGKPLAIRKNIKELNSAMRAYWA